MLICKVQNAALLGVGPLLQRESELIALDGVMAASNCVALIGGTCEKDEAEAPKKTMLSQELLRYWRIALAKTELLTRRLQW